MGDAVIYLDESGDLGWKLDRPYRNGGSSRHLTISAIVVASPEKYLPARFVKYNPETACLITSKQSSGLKWQQALKSNLIHETVNQKLDCNLLTC